MGEEEVLDESVTLDAGGEIAREAGSRGGAAVAGFGGPIPPRLATEVVLEGGKERVAFEPIGLSLAEGGKVAAVGEGGPALTYPGRVSSEKER